MASHKKILINFDAGNDTITTLLLVARPVRRILATLDTRGQAAIKAMASSWITQSFGRDCNLAFLSGEICNYFTYDSSKPENDAALA